MQILHGNNLELIKQIESNSIDSIVTDPPYGLGKEPDALKMLSDWILNQHHEVKGAGYMGKQWDSFVPQPIFWKECLRVLKPGGFLLSFGGARTYDLVTLGLRIAGFEIKESMFWVHAEGMPKGINIEKAMNKKGLDNSAEWKGFYSALKPAVEPIIMAQKQIEGTFVNNVSKYGCGALNIDACRIPLDMIADKSQLRTMKRSKRTNDSNEQSFGFSKNEDSKPQVINQSGRFPSNIIIDDSEEVRTLFPITQSGSNCVRTEEGYFCNTEIKHSGLGKPGDIQTTYGDKGSASRFFYCAKPSYAERHFGMSGKPQNNLSKKLIDIDKIGNGNHHPTIKPFELMQYLCRLVTPPKGTVFDPFMGSGTTGICAIKEEFDFIGMEQENSYFKIAKERISFAILNSH